MASHQLRRLAQSLRKSLIRIGADRLVRQIPLLSRLRPGNDLYISPSYRTVQSDNVRLRLDLSDYVQWLVYFDVERDLHRQLYSLVQPGDLALDIGANVGQVLLKLAAVVGSGGRAIGFEPNPATYRLCTENLTLNSNLPAEVHAIALGSAEGQVAFGRPCSANSGSDRVMSDGVGEIMVPVTTLDRWATAHSLERLDLVKIDVEGFELHVLRGASETLARFRPTLFIELCDGNLREQGGTAAELLAWLEAEDYAIVQADTGKPLAAEILTDCFLDIIARPR